MRFTAAVRCSFRGGIVPDVTPCASTYHHPCNPFTYESERLRTLLLPASFNRPSLVRCVPVAALSPLKVEGCRPC